MKGPSQLSNLKSKVIEEINENSLEFVEGWKQSNRNRKHKVLQKRHELLEHFKDHVRGSTNSMTTLLNNTNNKNNLTNKTIGEIKNLCMNEIRNKKIIENWKNSLIQEKTKILEIRNNVINEIYGQKSKIIKNKLNKVKLDLNTISKQEQKSILLNEIRNMKKGNSKKAVSDEKECIPAWKEIQLNQKRITLENKKMLNLEFQEQSKEALLENVCNIIEKRQKVLESIRNLQLNQPIVEEWKQNNRNNLSTPLLNKQQLLNDLIEGKITLKSIEDNRTHMLNSIKANSNNENITEEWKIKIQKEKLLTMKKRQQVLCDIHEQKNQIYKNLLESNKNKTTEEEKRNNLLNEVRNFVQDYYRNCDYTPVVENWKQEERNLKSSLINNKKRCLIDISEQKPSKMLKKVEMSDNKKHMNLLNEIRSEPLPIWKENLNNKRIETIQNKNKINNEIINTKFTDILENKNKVYENKINLNKEIKSKFGNYSESWKEEQYNQKTKNIACKNLINNEINEYDFELKNFKNQTELKQLMLKELRLKSDMTLPLWKEDILDEQSKINGNKNQLICEINENTKILQKNLIKTLNFNKLKEECLKELRQLTCQPIELWKELERNEITEKYNNKKEINNEIRNKNFNLENNKSFSEMRNLVLKDIRSLNEETIVPKWKEEKLAKRCLVFDNKMQLNKSIENLRI